MKKILLTLGVVLTIILATSFVQYDSTDDQKMIAFPDDYRNWTHVKSVVVNKKHSLYHRFGGMHHIYANDKALYALKESKDFKKGSILIFDLKKEIVADSFIYEGSRRGVSVMVKDSERFPETGGWGFEEFIKDNQRVRSVKNANEQCFSCHKTQIASDYVFSIYTD